MEPQRRRQGLSLATKLIATTVFLLAAAVGANGYFGLRSLDDLARSEAVQRRADGEVAMKTQAELVARNAATSAAPLMAGNDFTSLRSLAESTKKEFPRVQWILISDGTSDQVVVSVDSVTKEGDRLDDELSKQVVAQGSIISQRAANDPTSWTFASLIKAGDRTIGQLRLGISTKDLEEALAASIEKAQARARASARNQILIAAIILLVGILLAAYQGLAVARPLKALSAQASRIAGGDFNQRVHVNARDEVGQLADNFNAMAESLGSLLVEMAGKASMERELELARSVQRLMSPPPQLLQVGPFTLAGMCEPASQCGGDWWTYRQLSGDRLLVVVGDVTGHGMPAAMIAATGRGAVEALAHVDDTHLTAQGVLDAIDSAIRDVGQGTLLMTCFSMILNPRAGTITFANAGHCFPYTGRMDGTGKLADLGVLAVNGNPLGNPHKLVQTGTRPLRPGGMILLSTDGLCDRLAPNGDRYGDKRLRKVLMTHRPIEGEPVLPLRDLIVNEVTKFAGPQMADDDMTLVVCHYAGDRAAFVRDNVA